MPPPLQILCFGDSLTQGYHGYGAFTSPYSQELEEKLREAFPGREIKVVTSGVPGDRVCTSGFIKRMNNEWTSAHPTWLRKGMQSLGLASRSRFTWTIVLGGTNDIGMGSAVDRIFPELEKVWQIPLKSGGKVLALTVPECAAKSERLDTKRNELNERILEYKARNYYAFDLKTKIPYHSLSPEDQGRYWDDGLHLTTEGYEWMGRFIGDELIRLIREESALQVNPSVANARP